MLASEPIAGDSAAEEASMSPAAAPTPTRTPVPPNPWTALAVSRAALGASPAEGAGTAEDSHECITSDEPPAHAAADSAAPPAAEEQAALGLQFALETSDGAHALEEGGGATCAICVSVIEPMQAALVPMCDHAFCINCILSWLSHKPECPLCKREVTTVWTYRMLDGSYNDFLVEERVSNLVRAHWLRHVTSLRAPTHGEGGPLASGYVPEGWSEEEYAAFLATHFGVGRDAEDDDAHFDFDDDDELMLARARLGNRALANRAFGGGGFLRNGRRLAREGRQSRVRGAKGESKAPMMMTSIAAKPGALGASTAEAAAPSGGGQGGHRSRRGKAARAERAGGSGDAEGAGSSSALHGGGVASGSGAPPTQPTAGTPARAIDMPTAAEHGGGGGSAADGAVSCSPSECSDDWYCGAPTGANTARGRRSAKRHARMQKKIEAQQQKASARAALTLGFRSTAPPTAPSDDSEDEAAAVPAQPEQHAPRATSGRGALRPDGPYEPPLHLAGLGAAAEDEDAADAAALAEAIRLSLLEV